MAEDLAELTHAMTCMEIWGGNRVTSKTVIAEGLAAGERVVVDGQLRLTNGTRVTVQRSEEAPPPKAQPIPVAEQVP